MSVEAIIGLVVGLMTIVGGAAAFIGWVVKLSGRIQAIEHSNATQDLKMTALEQLVDHNRNNHKQEYTALMALLETLRDQIGGLRNAMTRIETRMERTEDKG
ncbi:MAG: hypothetical protein ABW128_05930 [Rhizorhabdus sp.]